MEAVIQKIVKGWKKTGYLKPSPVIRACLYMHLKEEVASPCIFDTILSTFTKVPEKGRGWFIRRVMEVGKEVFGDEACLKTAGVYYHIKRESKDTRWKVGVAMIERYWLGKEGNAQEG